MTGLVGIGLLFVGTALVMFTRLFSAGRPEPVPTSPQPPATPASPTAPASPAPTVPGEAPSLQAVIDAQLASLAEGHIAYAVPREMKAGVDSTVVVRISRGSSAGLVAGAPGQVEVEDVRVAPLMAAEVRGTEFTINPNGRQQQVIPPEGFSEWRWTVTPLSSGEQTLRFVVYVVLRLPDGDEKDYQIVEDRVVPVRVNAPYLVGRFFSEHWAQVSGVLTALFGSGVLWTVLNRRGKRRKAIAGTSR